MKPIMGAVLMAALLVSPTAAAYAASPPANVANRILKRCYQMTATGFLARATAEDAPSSVSSAAAATKEFCEDALTTGLDGITASQLTTLQNARTAIRAAAQAAGYSLPAIRDDD